MEGQHKQAKPTSEVDERARQDEGARHCNLACHHAGGWQDWKGHREGAMYRHNKTSVCSRLMAGWMFLLCAWWHLQHEWYSDKQSQLAPSASCFARPLCSSVQEFFRWPISTCHSENCWTAVTTVRSLIWLLIYASINCLALSARLARAAECAEQEATHHTCYIATCNFLSLTGLVREPLFVNQHQWWEAQSSSFAPFLTMPKLVWLSRRL